ncbi:agmatinase [Mycolicibacterium chitae]|uniref:Agmatinase n=1 Tax=Mycolicibacterium chitae TaxID=1792 RepID=A0A448IBS3_MYCCI|nr:agmatinase [Mycolicibacterium chitae]MCV7104901.1 agmatinase [Mycolicibacterium chitae]BBZ01070.1 agmatinase [Mycolicibacterium chitae]VEG49910.1 agmatinase [Mycolicibacterium chitae]
MNEDKSATSIVGAVDPQVQPRYAGWTTFARLPRLEDVEHADVVVVGVPFDSAVTYRPGARFGPNAIRQGSRLTRGYNPALDVKPFEVCQFADAGDIACNPFDIAAAVDQVAGELAALLAEGTKAVILGGDHSVALPSLRAAASVHGPMALVHFDAHLDTWDGYYGADITHGSPFRRAYEEGLLLDQNVHVGVRGSIYDKNDLVEDANFGFSCITCPDIDALGAQGIIGRIRERVGDSPVYVSVDIDVLDPAHAPGTGTPEAGGMSSRELLEVIRGLVDVNLVGADVVEVSPAYDHAEITAVAAANVTWEFLSVFARKAQR